MVLPLLIGITSAVRAAATETPSEARPKTVYVGVYVKQVRGISLKDSQVVLDFHLWFRWKDDRLKPLDSFDLINGKVESKESVYEAEVNGFHYGSCRIVATFHKLWDVARYPLDSHVLAIEIEDNDREADKLVYIPDTENSGLSEDAVVAGWVLSAGKAAVVTNRDRTNYGDISLPTGHESNWSRFVYTVKITRPGFGIFVKMFAGLFIATAIALHGLRIPPHSIDARLGLSVGAMFAAVASQYLVASTLPESNELMMADKLHILSFIFIFLSLAEPITVYKEACVGNDAKAVRIDRIFYMLLHVAYAVFAATIVLR